MGGFIEQQFGIQRPLAWLDRLEALVARELAPSARKIRTALRISTIVTIAIGLDASCHVNTQLGAVIVWLLAGAGPMMSIRKALAWQIAVMLALITSVVMARAFAETPWLMLPFVFVWIWVRVQDPCMIGAMVVISRAQLRTSHDTIVGFLRDAGCAIGRVRVRLSDASGVAIEEKS